MTGVSELSRLPDLVQVSDMVQDNVASFTAPQLAAMCGAYVQLCRHSYNDSQLFDAIVEQVLRSFKVRGCLLPPMFLPEAAPKNSSQPPGARYWTALF